jgi:hypothetical protein
MSSYDVQRRELFPIILEAISKAYNEYGLGLAEELAKAEALHIFKDTADAGYRKASDVAREIFEEIEKALDNSVETEHFKGTWFNFSKFKQRLAELKKKYESESTNEP